MFTLFVKYSVTRFPEFQQDSITGMLPTDSIEKPIIKIKEKAGADSEHQKF